MASKANGKTVLTADVRMPHIGPWHADLVVDATELTGKVTLVLEGSTFVGTVTRSGVHGGRLGTAIVGGNGGLSKELPAKNYAGAAGTKLSAILADILSECGETLSATADASTLAQTFSAWHRTAGPASHAIQSLVDEVGAVWKVEQGGAIWVGPETFPEVKPTHVLIDEDWTAGVLTIAVESPNLDPGTTFRGQRILAVIHRLGPNALRTEAHLTHAATSLGKFLGYIRRQVDYSRLYPATVSLQNADGTLQVVPDDKKAKGSGLDKVPYKLGVPGTVKVTAGQRVLVGFMAGDPARPFALAWQGGAADELALLAGLDYVALAAKVLAELNKIKTTLDGYKTTFDAHTHVYSPGPNSPIPTAPPASTFTAPQAPASVAAAKVKAE